MTKLEQLRAEFPSLSTWNLHFWSGVVRINHIDIDNNYFEGLERETLHCGCCEDYIEVEGDLEWILDDMSDENFQILIDDLKK